MDSLSNDFNLHSYAEQIPFAKHLGFELVKFEGGESEILYTAKPEHLNTFDVTHGGACMTLLDVAMAAASRSQTPEIGVVTIEMKTSFMQPSVGPLRARGKLLHRTATLAFTEAKIYDAQERVCAHATGTFKFVKRRLPTGPASANAMRPPSTD
ncbi:PaaI family thioesterase [Variovorax sp. M-6]|uniref:PaaI family thioesterase n=1 Tax=Variovorax sp. M-6 TaxID=3233041 RepID=UPI003F9575AB